MRNTREKAHRIYHSLGPEDSEEEGFINNEKE